MNQIFPCPLNVSTVVLLKRGGRRDYKEGKQHSFMSLFRHFGPFNILSL